MSCLKGRVLPVVSEPQSLALEAVINTDLGTVHRAKHSRHNRCGRRTAPLSSQPAQFVPLSCLRGGLVEAREAKPEPTWYKPEGMTIFGQQAFSTHGDQPWLLLLAACP